MNPTHDMAISEAVRPGRFGIRFKAMTMVTALVLITVVVAGLLVYHGATLALLISHRDQLGRERQVGRFERPGVHPFDHGDPRVAPEVVVDLAVGDVEGDHLGSAPLQQAVGEPSGRRSHVEAAEAAHVETEPFEGILELDSAPGNERRRAFDQEFEVGRNLLTGSERRRSVPPQPDLPRPNRPGGSRTGGEKTPTGKQSIESFGADTFHERKRYTGGRAWPLGAP